MAILGYVFIKFNTSKMVNLNLDTFRFFAHFYYSMGFNVTSISNIENDYNYFNSSLLKAPTTNWEHLITKRQTIEELIDYEWENATGIGCVLGYNNIRCIDIDGVTDLNLLKEILELLNLPLNYEWAILTGSGNGLHIYIKSEEHNFVIHNGQTKAFYPNKAYGHKFNILELRWKYHCVLPPSIHKSYNSYKFINGIPKSLPQSLDVYKINRLVDKFCKHSYGDVLKYEVSANYYFLNTKDYGYYSSKEDRIELSERRFLVFDTETNGIPSNWNLPPDESNNWPNLIQIGWYVFGENANFINKESIIIKPEGFVIDSKISELTNITQDYALQFGISLKEALLLFFDAVEKADFVIAHNFEFDENVILAESIRNSLENPFQRLEFKEKKICTMKSAVNYCNLPNLKYPKLSELYEILFKEKIEIEHNALFDSKITAKCFWELLWRDEILIE